MFTGFFKAKSEFLNQKSLSKCSKSFFLLQGGKKKSKIINI